MEIENEKRELIVEIKTILSQITKNEKFDVSDADGGSAFQSFSFSIFLPCFL